MNRQIRRMCEYFGYEVTKLERTRIMNVSLKGLPLGEWRELTEQEMAGIFKMIKNSSSTQDPSKTKRVEKPANSSLVKQTKATHPKPFNRNKPKSADKTSKNSARNAKNPSRGKTAVFGKPKSRKR